VGPATRIPELSTTSTENRPSLRKDGLEIFSTRLGQEVWGNGLVDRDTPHRRRSLVDARQSRATVNSTATDIHPYLSLDAQTLVFSSSRDGGSGGTDLYMTTRAQILPKTKDDCKKGAWESFGIFRNQGDCVSYVASGGKNEPGYRRAKRRNARMRPAPAALFIP
jgi:hypothetical protein